ncbi:3-phosphoshikimate 1-carboxyvinyltransferase [Amycolatopsis sp. NPDC059090]|uniref:3-phosphoshikimate 1-carboxyvinyltransferase n=1 Tax=unclassified Amycolatopsis TaxID=2618356 RepID=UPI00366FDF71
MPTDAALASSLRCGCIACIFIRVDKEEGDGHGGRCSRAFPAGAQKKSFANTPVVEETSIRGSGAMRLFVSSPPRPLSGDIWVPGSKYHEHRALVLASLADGVSRVTGLSNARHTAFTRAVLGALGTRVAPTADGVEVTGGAYRVRRTRVSVGSSGTTLYFMLGLASLADRPVTFIGQKYFRRRPIRPLLSALHSMGVRFDSAGGLLPITVYPGRPTGGRIRIAGTLSQWVSGLLLLAPFATSTTVVEVEGVLNEKPYVDLTIALMAEFGLTVHASADARRFEIEPGQSARPAEVELPPDLGSAAFGLGAAALHESSVLFRGLHSVDPAEIDHPESDFLSALELMGLDMRLDHGAGGIRVQHDGSPLDPFTLDCRDIPDMVPVLAALATFASGTSTLANVAHARLKESDRVAAMTQLNKMGARLGLDGDRLTVRGAGRLYGAELSSFNDHRIVMALAVAASRARGRSSIKNAEAHRLSYPGFVTDLSGIGMPISLGPPSAEPAKPSAPVRGATIVGRVAELAARNPHGPAIFEVQGATDRRTDWAELDSQARRIAAFLRSAGVGVGDRVAYQLPNTSEFVAVTLATLRVGGICVPLMPIFRRREQELTLRQARAKVLFIPDRFRGRDYRAEIRELPDTVPLEHVIVAGEVGDAPEDGAAQAWHCLGDLLQAPVRDVPVAASGELSAQLLFTSGTTGEPKGVLHRHRSLDLAAEAQIRRLGLGPDDVVYVPSPMAHQTGFLYGMWLAVTLGVPQVLQAEWDAGSAADAIERRGVTFVQAATPFLSDLVAESRRVRRTGPRTFVATGAAVPRKLAVEAHELWHTAVGGAFGTTETCLGTSFGAGDPPHKQWGTDGKALEKVELRIVDDESARLGPGCEGNLEVRSETMFEGYFERPDLTEAAFTADGWYRTGDLAVLDDDGHLRLTGRAKDIINRGGEKVPVAEVEQLLHEHPAVAEAAVVAMPDDRLGERGCAFVAPRPDAEFGFAAMQTFLAARGLTVNYWPERLELLDALPRNAVGKVQKAELRARIKAILRTGKEAVL